MSKFDHEMSEDSWRDVWMDLRPAVWVIIFLVLLILAVAFVPTVWADHDKDRDRDRSRDRTREEYPIQNELQIEGDAMWYCSRVGDKRTGTIQCRRVK